MCQDPQAFLVCLGERVPRAFPALRDPRVLQGRRAPREQLARRAASATSAAQDPRAARETLALSAHPERKAWQEPLGLLGLRDPPDPLGHQDQDLLLDLMIWKAPDYHSGQQAEAPRGCRDLLVCRDLRGTPERQGHLEPREKSEQTVCGAFLVSPGKKVQVGPRGPKERKGARGKGESQEEMEWDSRAFLGPLDPQGLWSTCPVRMEPLQVCQDLRAGRGSQVFQDPPGQRVTWVPKASKASRGPRVRRGSLVPSSAPMAELWALPRKEPRESQVFEDPRVHMGGPGTRARSASLDGRVAPA